MTIATAGTDYYAPGATDVAVADGGTGSSTAANARTALGLAIGTDVQAFDTDLNSLAGLTLAQGDILYRNGTQLTNLAAGTAGQFLSTGGAGANVSWVSGALASFDAIVASSGGTHTTLGAAITAASAGWRILVLDNTTEGSSINTSLASLYITGVNKASTVVNPGANIVQFTGTNVVIENLGFNVSNAATALTLTGANSVLRNVKADLGSASPNGGSGGDKVIMSGNYSLMTNCEVVTTATTGATARYVYVAGTGSRCIGNHFKIGSGSSTIPGAAGIYMPTASGQFSDNYIEANGFTTDCEFVFIAGANSKTTDNVFSGNSASVSYVAMQIGGAYAVCSGNAIRCGNRGIDSYGDGVTITGNTIVCGDTASAKGIQVYSNNNQVVTGNLVNTIDGTKAGDGIYVNADDCVVTGNRVRGFTNGVTISAAGNDRTVVVGNALNDNTNGVADTGTGTVAASNS